MTKIKIFLKILIFLQVLLLLFGATLGVYAQPTTPSTTPNSSNAAQAKPLDVCKEFGSCLAGTNTYSTGDSKDIVTSLTTNIVNILTIIAGGIAVLFIVLGGYKYITSNGDDSKAKEARGMVINACIGLVVILASYTIVSFIAGFISTLDISGSPTSTS